MLGRKSLSSRLAEANRAPLREDEIQLIRFFDVALSPISRLLITANGLEGAVLSLLEAGYIERRRKTTTVVGNAEVYVLTVDGEAIRALL